MSKVAAAGRVAVITGGASGIGLGVATHLAEAGHPVALLDRQGELAVKEAEALSSGGAGSRRKAIGIETDVSDRASIDAALARVRADLGPIAIAVTSAGIEAQTPFCDIPADEWDRIIAVNLTGTFHSLQAAVPDMKAAGWGRIVTISSSSAQSGAPDRAHYVASKGGVIALTKALSYELAPLGSRSTRSRRRSSTPRWRKAAWPRATSPISMCWPR